MSRPVRKRYLVRPFQYRLILFQALYFALLGGVAFFSGIVPLLDTIQDERLSLGERAEGAAALIYFDRHVLPFVGPLVLALFAHALLVSHRIAGPLYRFSVVLRSLAAGDLSMRVRIRPRDYLHDEARAFDDAVAALRRRIADARSRAQALEGILEELPACVPDSSSTTLQEARTALAALRAGLDEFVLEPPAAPGSASDPRQREAA